MLRVKGWSKFQHFKDRNPPWIKLYKNLLDDPDWHELSPKNAKLLVMIWLATGEFSGEKGELPCTKKLAFRLRVSEAELLTALQGLSHWVRQDDINVISERYLIDAPETETETETEVCVSGCPHQKIINLYNTILTDLPQVKPALWNGARKVHLKARWKEDVERQNLDWWRGYFESVSGMPFLLGKNNNHWKADMAWLITPGNMAKVLEGNFVDRGKPGIQTNNFRKSNKQF